MSHYLSGVLMLLLLAAAALMGMEAFGVYNAARMVDAALLDAQLELARSGGLSARAEQLVTERIRADGGDPGRLEITGTPPGTPYGELVTLRVIYRYSYRLPLLSPASGATARTGTFRIERRAVTTSGWSP